VTEIVPLLAGTGTVHCCSPVGALDLKGLPAPVPACEVAWEPVGEPSLPMPALLAGAGRIFVGRDEELDRHGRLWKEATSGERRGAALAREPGIGTTRLAVALATRRCAITSTRAPERRLGRYPGNLTRLLPELTHFVDGLPEPLRSDPETEAPVLLVHDDLHWAAEPTPTTTSLRESMLNERGTRAARRVSP